MFAHGLKEALRRIYKIRDVVFVENALVYWCEKAETSQIKDKLVNMAQLLCKHAAGIVAFWKTGITSAAMEGFNNKIGWLTRQAYGYRDAGLSYLKDIRFAKPKNCKGIIELLQQYTKRQKYFVYALKWSKDS